MRNYVYVFLITILIMSSGCGAFRKVFKSKEYLNLETKYESRKDSTGLIIDKSVTTVKEKLDTVIMLPGQTVRQDTYLTLDSLVNGMTAVRNDLWNVRLVLNPVTGILTTTAIIKPQLVPVKIEREIVKENDITEKSAKTESKKEEEKKSLGSSVTDKKPVNFWWFVVGFGILLIIVTVFKFLWKNKFL